MTEKMSVESVEEDKNVLPSEEEEQTSEAETPKDDFEKDSETVAAARYNQAIRKQREIELEKRELEKRLSEIEASKEKTEEKEEVDDFFKEEEEKTEKVDPSTLIDEKLKPVMESLKRREENDRKIQRDAFFEAHPKYLKDSKLWQSLLDEVDNFNPHSKDDYYTQLSKAHRILSGDTVDAVVETKKKEIAGDAVASGDGAEKATIKEEFTAEDRKYQKQFNVSDEGMRAYKEKLKTGALRILS